MPQPAIARPVFSTEDFNLLRRAVVHYIKTAEGDAEIAKFSHLHHRLGRVG
jgi:hypothetical protein